MPANRKNEKNNSKIDKSIRFRIGLLRFFFFLAAGLLIARLAWVQLYNVDAYSQKAIENRTKSVIITPKRGSIYDRNGEELAMSCYASTLAALPKEIKNPKGLAAALAPILDQDETAIYKKLTDKHSFVYVQRKLSYETMEKLKNAKFENKPILQQGFQLIDESKRYYPRGTLAAQVIGFTGMDNNGLDGIEYSFEKILHGTDGYMESERDGLGNAIPGSYQYQVPPKNGNDLYLTIDTLIQYVAEQELLKAVKASGLKAGTVIVANPKTGEIYAMANYPTYDPNNFAKYPARNRINYAISNNYEPGSTFKSVVASAALEEDVVKDSDRFYCTGSIKIPGGVMHDHVPHGAENFPQVVANSCNIGFTQIGLNRLGANKLFQYIEAFGFGQKTGIPLPGEATGIVRSPENIRPIELANESIGQGIAVTPIQLVAAVSAVANGGYLLEPQIVREIKDQDTGKVVQRFKPKVVRQVISKETSAHMRRLLEGVVTEGTGKLAAVSGFSVAGKTGTAQKIVNGRYVPGKYISSFIGFLPAEDPQFIILVVLDEPTKGDHFGGTIAAPVFQAVAETAVREFNLKPDQPVPQEKSVILSKVPDLLRKPASQAVTELHQTGFGATVVGSGKIIISQSPAPGEEVSPGTVVMLYTKEEQGEYVIVPDLAGQTIRKAAEMLNLKGLKLKPMGSGIAASQIPAAGTAVKPGELVTVQFRP